MAANRCGRGGPFADPGSFIGFEISAVMPGGVVVLGLLASVDLDILELENAEVCGSHGTLHQDRFEISRKHLMGIGRMVRSE